MLLPDWASPESCVPIGPHEWMDGYYPLIGRRHQSFIPIGPHSSILYSHWPSLINPLFPLALTHHSFIPIGPHSHTHTQTINGFASYQHTSYKWLLYYHPNTTVPAMGYWAVTLQALNLTSGLRAYGHSGLWVHGCMGAWVYGRMGVWMY